MRTAISVISALHPSRLVVLSLLASVTICNGCKQQSSEPAPSDDSFTRWNKSIQRSTTRTSSAEFLSDRHAS